jgi:hypothetical protein
MYFSVVKLIRRIRGNLENWVDEVVHQEQENQKA